YWKHLNFPKRTYKHDLGENQYRRGLYTYWCRTFLHPSMLAFDAPSREESCVERARSNTPLAALVLLNDPTYVEAARAFAERILREQEGDDKAKLTFAFRQTLHRAPTEDEQRILIGLLVGHRQQYRADADAAAAVVKNGLRPEPKDLDKTELASWTSVSRVILNLHEFISRN
ncbi:MAG: DUF1553 domain-containing protein, partial [Pirellulaceae bacterium]|nr:DUF1553 domain-containing protein [Pirellulaceae bacterium]